MPVLRQTSATVVPPSALPQSVNYLLVGKALFHVSSYREEPLSEAEILTYEVSGFAGMCHIKVLRRAVELFLVCWNKRQLRKPHRSRYPVHLTDDASSLI